jgi:flagellin-like hook-associated protein FlgL
MSNNVDWLREHMHYHMRQAAAGGATEPIPSVAPLCQSALNLVSQAGEVMRELHDRVSETEAHAQYLITRAIEKLQQSESRAEAAEIKRRQAEEDAKRAIATIEELEKTLAAAQSRVVAAEQRAEIAEARADEAANEAATALMRIEDAIRIKLLGAARKASRNATRAA